MRHRHLRKMGYNTTIIPYWVWLAQVNSHQRNQYLIEALKAKPIRFIASDQSTSQT